MDQDKKWSDFPTLEELKRLRDSDCIKLSLWDICHQEIIIVPRLVSSINTLADLKTYLSLYYERVGWNPDRIEDMLLYYGDPPKLVSDKASIVGTLSSRVQGLKKGDGVMFSA